MRNLDGRVALVTGGTGGIGQQVSRSLDALGASVLVHSRSSGEAGRDLSASLGDSDHIEADLGRDDSAEFIADVVEARWGRLDILVNCAGITKVIPHDDLSTPTREVWRDILEINLVATWSLTAACVPMLRDSPSASVVNVSSVAGIRPMGSSIPYAVSKAGVNHLTVLLARVLGPRIRVNAVAPGVIDTPWTKDFRDHRRFVEEQTPLQRVGTPMDVADAVIYLTTNDYVTGEVIMVDGGLHATY